MRREPVARARANGTRTVGGATLGFGLLGGAGAWIAHLGGSYGLVPYVCGTDQEHWLHLLTLGAGVVAATATVAAWRAWRRLQPLPTGERTGAPEVASGEEATAETGEGAPSVPDPPGPRRERMQAFLAVSGILLSGFFLALIVAEGFPALLQGEPCRFVPTRDRPIIRLEPGPLLALGSLASPRGLAGRPGGRAGRPFRLAPLLASVWLLATTSGALGHEPTVGPRDVWTSWNWDPWLLCVLGGLTVLYLRGLKGLWGRAGRGRGIPRWRAVAYLSGVGALFIALISPVDAASQALFSIHMVQHLLLMVVAAPLLVLGRPMVAYLWGLPKRWRRRAGGWWRRSRRVRMVWRVVGHPLVVLVLHVVALWVWHIPELYQAALESRAVHHLEHASFFFTAMLFWWALAQAGGRRRWPGYGAGVLYVFATALQSGALGALITFAPRPWYPAHAPGAAAWQMDPLVDQQVAGVLMWVPMGLVYAAAAVALFLAWLGEAERTVGRRERFGWDLSTTGSRKVGVGSPAASGEHAEGETS